MIWTVFILIFGLFLAYANGANDNFKGVATLYGSRTTTYKKSLIWTTIFTLLGSLTALYFAGELLIVFKGKGLVPSEVIALNEFPIAVGLGAALTVMLATVLALPVSTTHALIGALAGAGIIASSTGINFTKLAQSFFLPLIAGPLLSILLAMLIYPILKKLKDKLGVKENTCLCIGNKTIATSPLQIPSVSEFVHLHPELKLPSSTMASEAYCKSHYEGFFLGFSVHNFLEKLHYFSAALVCFARGLNDTPKIAALLLIGSRFSLQWSITLVGVFILIGGIIHSKKIADTMGNKVTSMNPGQALTANLVTGFMVFGASKMGVPVSTTHVSCGSIFGIASITRKAQSKMILHILLAWVTTLPLGFIFGAGVMFALRQLL
ncbi:hypothetical protein A9Q84_04510 [Halobacteriovorax marinus]|uniref:Phosphate transporter n=1 Tax=Halobacteriovorax marinus TaxID=97084 RepID=A0A1Y5FAG3_9BACT|nr:hypothetical protein A9Q84_04510 [Halobacteriovorax marinus]